MGTWGYDLLDNDAARDLEVVWDTYVARGRETDPERWTPEHVMEFFRHTYWRSPFRGANALGVDLENGETATEVLALGALLQRDGLPLPEPFREVLATAANLELSKDRLREWDRPRRREKALVALLETIGAEREAAAPSANPLREEVAKLREFSRHYPKWIAFVRHPRVDEEAERLWPSFIDRLGETVGKGTRTTDSRLEDAAFQLRLMCLAFCAGWWLDLPDEETLALIEKAKRTRGRVSALYGLRGRG